MLNSNKMLMEILGLWLHWEIAIKITLRHHFWSPWMKELDTKGLVRESPG